ncbi:hypothetical protein FS749_011576 [Ceratobasidium sp. UAMH 11750]|nr:hypothetical protein FS749_011576 [Ceratobasidium sp. UAMH 11750]
MLHRFHTQGSEKVRPQNSLSSPVRYATPGSLPAAFGVEAHHAWASSSPATSTRYTPSVAGPGSVTGSTRTHSELDIINELLRRHPPPSLTPASTAEWVRHASESMSTSNGRYAELLAAHKERASHTDDAACDEPPNDGEFNIDGSVPNTSGDEESSPRRKSKYIDDAATESKSKGKRSKHKANQVPKNVKKPSARKLVPLLLRIFLFRSIFCWHATRWVAETNESDNEPQVSKRRKNNSGGATGSRKHKPKPKTQRNSEAESGNEMSDLSSASERAPKRKQPAKATNPLNKWSGTSQGTIKFLPTKPANYDRSLGPLWTYSADGINRQSPNHHALGDIHFSPSLAPGDPFHYWVQVGTKDGGQWELYNPGRQHPVYAGYTLKEQMGRNAPCWEKN